MTKIDACAATSPDNQMRRIHDYALSLPIIQGRLFNKLCRFIDTLEIIDVISDGGFEWEVYHDRH